ncbi:MAG TPA: LuxR C-terminal-related transcriptional regulator [Marmoricola sp.]|nr:LuxR C-terminal-related transcriptional regulator [Marmoricola sp.]
METKLLVPQTRGDVVARKRLTEVLDRGRSARLTLVSAPAGFGKTTLLTRWLADRSTPVAWVSLEEGDSRPLRFWGYLVAAVQRAAPGVGDGAAAMLQRGRPDLDTVVATLVNELATAATELVLVLDDYHLVDDPALQACMVDLVEHLPAKVQLVISTRVDPALPLARMRARGELVEVRAADLRFTLPEVASYLTEVSALELSPDEVSVLESRTEGWIAALQLAALSLRGREETSAFIADFAGDDRYVVDYLVEEVLDRQSAPVRQFLLQTSVLDRLSGPLCAAVTGDPDSQRMLEQLERANLFVVPLDGRRRWYRYHHLFGEVLRTYLLDAHPGEVAELHRRASRWYDEAGDPVSAVRHAVAAGDVDRAADLAELALPTLQRDRQEGTVVEWVGVFPDELVHARPVLAHGFVSALMSSGQFDGVRERLDELEQRVPAGRGDPPQGTVVVDRAAWERLPGSMALHRSGLALIEGDPDATIAHAEQAMSRAAKDDHLTRAGAAATAGLARWTRGELEDAHRFYSLAVDGLRRVGHVSDVLGCSITLADLRITQGRLEDARCTYEDALRLAEHDPAPVTRGVADMHVGLSEVALARNDLAAAAHHLERSRVLGDAGGLPQHPYRSRVAQAGLAAAEGDVARAVELLDDAERVYFGDFAPNVRPIPSMRARLHLALGNLDAAASWARARRLSAGDQLSYLREHEHLTLAMVLLAQHRAGRAGALEDATRLLERLRLAAQEGGRHGNLLEVLVQLALAAWTAGQRSGAAELVRRALVIAEREGHVRVFLDAGPALAAVLRTVSPNSSGGRHAARVLGVASPVLALPLVDQLSERELDVLRYLDTDLGGPEIARELSVSVNTVRTHTRHIYAKLGASNRREAVRAAVRLGLLRTARR